MSIDGKDLCSQCSNIAFCGFVSVCSSAEKAVHDIIVPTPNAGALYLKDIDWVRVSFSCIYYTPKKLGIR